MLLYALLYLTGYDVTLDDIEHFRQLGSKTPGHPEAERTPGVEATTGPLGQGFGNSVGMAIAEAHLGAVNNREDQSIVDHFTYCICGDGDLMEGISQEALSLAGHLKLGKLIVFYDDNQVSLAGPTDITLTDDPIARFDASGWHTQLIPIDKGNDVAAIDQAIEVAKNVTDRPSFIAVRTHIGYGSPRQDNFLAHGEALGAENVRKSKEELGWPLEPDFYVPDDVLAFYRQVGEKGAELERRWRETYDVWKRENPQLAASLERALRQELPSDLPWPIVRRRKRQRRNARRRRLGYECHRDELARTRRGIGRPRSVDQDLSQELRRFRARETTPAATSITACANTRWPPAPTASPCTAACFRLPPPSSTSSITSNPRCD